MNFEIERDLGDGLRYTEALLPADAHGPSRQCALWLGSGEAPVSSLRLYSFALRFGAVAVASEGYGGVQTLPEHRGRGYVKTVLEQSLAGAATRVSVAFLYGIEKLYPKVGFVSCLADSSLSVRVRHAEAAPASGHEVTPMERGDFAAMTELYNEDNATRPWTIVRGPELAERFTRAAVWQPSPRVVVARRGGQARGYAVLAGIGFGHAPRAFAVSELAAADDAAAGALIAEAAKVSWERRVDTFTIAEPPDGRAGSAARRLGCEVRQYHPGDGSGMGAILDRAALLDALEGELARRERCVEEGLALERAEGCALAGPSKSAFAALRERKLVPEDGSLLKLLLGFWSWQDALRAGVELPASERRVLCRWFPGPSPALPAPHSHQIDHY